MSASALYRADDIFPPTDSITRDQFYSSEGVSGFLSFSCFGGSARAQLCQATVAIFFLSSCLSETLGLLLLRQPGRVLKIVSPCRSSARWSSFSFPTVLSLQSPFFPGLIPPSSSSTLRFFWCDFFQQWRSLSRGVTRVYHEDLAFLSPFLYSTDCILLFRTTVAKSV